MPSFKLRFATKKASGSWSTLSAAFGPKGLDRCRGKSKDEKLNPKSYSILDPDHV